jgi:hypothetical protein
MQTASIMLNLADQNGGPSGTQVPRFDVTPAEIAVLRIIHGDDAVTDIRPGEDTDRTNREELGRLNAKYGKPLEGSSPVNQLFPGAAARVFETFDELELPEEFFATEKRVSTKSTDEGDTKPKRGKKGKPEQNDPANPPAVDPDASNGEGDIDDEHSVLK